MRMNIALLISCNILLAAFSIERKAQGYEIPMGAKIIETTPLISNLHPNRALMLWMLNPTENPDGYEADDPYTCPDETRGSCYSGATRVSLLNTKDKRIINTVQVKDVHVEGKDTFDIPYKIRKGYYYYVKEAKEGMEEKPIIMLLKDYNGDGKALEFALFDAPFCMGLQTTLIGYSESQDRVIQYPIMLKAHHDGKQTLEISQWLDYLFSEKPIAPGHWKYEVDYRGRGGWLERYDIRYNARTERFEGTIVTEER